MKTPEIEKTAKTISAALKKASESLEALLSQVRNQNQDSGTVSLDPKNDSADAWFLDLSPEEKAKLKRFYRSGQSKVGIAVADTILTLKTEAGRDDYRKVIQQYNAEVSSTKSTEKRALAIANLSVKYRDLSQRLKKAHQFFNTLTGIKNPIPKDSFSPYVGY